MNRFINFMYGRYGRDNLGNFLFFSSIIFMLTGAIFRSYILYLIAVALAAWNIFRSFSRKTERRRKENQIYLNVRSNAAKYSGISFLISKFKAMKLRLRDRKTHVYQKCPYCKNTLRLKKIKGRHTVNCPCCRQKFDIKI